MLHLHVYCSGFDGPGNPVTEFKASDIDSSSEMMMYFDEKGTGVAEMFFLFS
jgi:hypothetical protein